MLLVLSVILYFVYTIYHKWTTGICKCKTTMKGKVILMTGACSGTGFEVAKNLAARGARVILAGRDIAKGLDAVDRICADTGSTEIYFKQVDFESFRSVRNLAYEILNNELRLDVLINNVAIGSSKQELTEDGLPKQIQVNHFSPFLLTMLLVELMKFSAPSRIITTTSWLHKVGRIDPKIFDKPRQGFWQHLTAFPDSKLANVLFMRKLCHFLRRTGVTVSTVDPGTVSTDCCRKQNFLLQLILRMFFKTASEGAQTVIHAAVAPGLTETSGRHYVDCKEAYATGLAYEQAIVDQLWDISEHHVGFADLK